MEKPAAGSQRGDFAPSPGSGLTLWPRGDAEPWEIGQPWASVSLWVPSPSGPLFLVLHSLFLFFSLPLDLTPLLPPLPSPPPSSLPPPSPFLLSLSPLPALLHSGNYSLSMPLTFTFSTPWGEERPDEKWEELSRGTTLMDAPIIRHTVWKNTGPFKLFFFFSLGHRHKLWLSLQHK